MANRYNESVGQQIAIGAFEARFENVKTHLGLVLSTVHVQGSNVIVSREPAGVEMLEPGQVEVKIDEQALKVYLDEQAPGGLRNFEVEIEGGKMRLHATLVMLVPIKAAAVCTLRIVDGRQIFVDLASVEVFGVGATGLVEGHLAKINPVLDVKDIPLDVKLDSVDLEDGYVLVRGTARPKAVG